MVDASMSTAIAIRNPFAGGGKTPKGEGSDGLLGQIAANTAMTVQILQAVVTGTPQERAEQQAEATQRRQEKLDAGETDPGGPGRLKGFIKGIGSGISGVASKLNPFGSGFMFGNIGKLLLAGGGVLLLRRFSEELIDPLTNMLQEIADKGFKQKLIDIKDNIKERLEPTLIEMKLAFTNFMDAIDRSIIFVKSIYTMVNDYIMSFDTQGVVGPAGMPIGDGKLDMEELGFLKEDLQKKATEAISGFFKGVFTELGNKIMSSEYFLPVATGLLLYGPVSSIFGFAGGGAAVATAKLSAMQKLSIFALLAFGIRQTYKSYDEAMRETLEKEQGNFNFATFASIFLGGADNAAGSVAMGYKQALRGGGTGLLAGMAIGSVIPGVGTIVGGAIGLIAGGVIGFLSGKAGTDRVKEIVDGMLISFDDFITDIGNFFYDIANGFRYLMTGRGFSKGYNARRLGSTSALQDELEKETVVLDKLKAMQEQFPELDLEEDIAKQQGVVDLKAAQIIAAPSMEKVNKFDQASLQLSNAEMNFKKLQQRIFTGKDENGDGRPDLDSTRAMFKFSKDIGVGSIGGAFAGVKDPVAEAAIGPDGTNLDAYMYYLKTLPGLRSKVASMKSAMTPRDLSLVESSNEGTLLENPYVLNPNLVQQGDLSAGTASIVTVPPINELMESSNGVNGVSVNNNNIIDNSKEGGKSFTINQGELDAFDKSNTAGVVLSDSLSSRLSN